jgi:peptidoglycan/xylan/chitin deacetylase (PgdA/CDA1 family)
VIRRLKPAAFFAARSTGVTGLVMRSQWRTRRLLILCYHGISLEREHEWDGELFMSPEQFGRRLELLKKHRCSVLPLEEALERTVKGTLPPRSVSITFDDGLADFHRKAMPLLKQFGFPATVYVTSFYVSYNRAVFLLACSYLLWKYRDRELGQLPFIGQPTGRVDLRNAEERAAVVRSIHAWKEAEKPSAERQDQALQDLAKCLGADAGELTRSRVLHLMTPGEVAEAARQGFSVQLHTHRHRTPLDESLFAREIVENRQYLQAWTGNSARDFCYPNGDVHPEFPGWLRQLGVTSGVTCEPGLHQVDDDPLLLPRLVDHSGMSELEFESWLSGTGAWIRKFRRGTSGTASRVYGKYPKVLAGNGR